MPSPNPSPATSVWCSPARCCGSKLSMPFSVTPSLCPRSHRPNFASCPSRPPASRDTINQRSSRPFAMAIRKKKSNAKPRSNGNRSRNGSRATTTHVGAGALVRPVERSSTGSPNQHHRTYNIPDFRQEHPNLSVRQTIEKDKDGIEHVRYEVEGDLDAPVPPIRNSKYLTRQQAIEI